MTSRSLTHQNPQPHSQQYALVCHGHTRPVVDLHFSPLTADGYFLISACKDGSPQLRRGATGDWIGTFQGHKGAVWGARLDSLATRALTASADFTAKIWDAVSGDELQSLSHKHIVRCADFCANYSNLIATGGNEKILRIWDLNANDKEPEVLLGCEDTIRKLCWLNAQTVVTGGDDKEIKKWDLRSGKPSQIHKMEATVMSIELGANASYLVVTAGKTVSFIDSSDLVINRQFRYERDNTAASLHPDSSRFVTGSADLWVRVHDFADGKELEVYKGHHGPVHATGFSPDGALYATGSEDGTIRLWQTVPGSSYGLWQGSSSQVEAIG